MADARRKIILDFAKWTALSALRSGSPIKSRSDVYMALDTVQFTSVLQPIPAISQLEFDAWHEVETLALCARESRLQVGWGAKLINVYLKTAAYVGELGRPGLRDALHPPIDSGSWAGLVSKFRGRADILNEVRCVKRIKDISDYETYRRIIAGCRAAAGELGCSLIEVEQLWMGSATPAAELRRP